MEERAAALRASGRHGPLRVGPSDVGARVVLRHVVADGVSDVIGELLDWSDGRLTVRRRSGEVATVAEALLVSGKRL
jgi:hypothetical protein